MTQQATVAVQPILVPSGRFSHVHVDLVGPLPVEEDGSRFLFTMVNRSSRWLKAVPLKNAEMSFCVDALIGMWIAWFGVPAVLTSDRGQQFISQVWADLCFKLEIPRHTMTTAYHPQSNGMVEKAHRHSQMH